MRPSQYIKLQEAKRVKNIELAKEKGPFHRTLAEIHKVRRLCEKLNTDFCLFITGMEGTGKSSIASRIVKAYDPDFDIDTQMIYELKGTKNSLTSFMDKYVDVPFKAAWFDEAVSVLFSLSHGTKASAEAQEIFKVKRSCRHFDVLVSPSFWDLVPDIRERRVKVVLYTFREPVYGKVGTDPDYIYKVAMFGTRKILALSANKHAKLAFRSPKDLFKIVKPDYIEEFPPMDKEFSSSYLKSKREHLQEVLDRVANKQTDSPEEVEEAITEIKPKAKPKGRPKKKITGMDIKLI